MHITRAVSGAAATLIIAYASAAAPAPNEAARTAFMEDFLKVTQWHVCNVHVEYGQPEHVDAAATFKFERVGTKDVIKVVPLTGTWGVGWWHLELALQGDPGEPFKLNPKSWPKECKGSGEDVASEKHLIGDETNTVRFVGDACLPSLEPDGTCRQGGMHRVFVFFRPAANGGKAGNHLYIEHCAPAEESKGHCEPLHPATPSPAAMTFRPHPGHIHSDP